MTVLAWRRPCYTGCYTEGSVDLQVHALPVDLDRVAAKRFGDRRAGGVPTLGEHHRVVENADRVEAQRGNGDTGLKVFHITFHNGRLQARVAPPEADVVDVAAVEVSA